MKRKFSIVVVLILICAFFIGSVPVSAATSQDTLAIFISGQPDNVKNYLARTGVTYEVMDTLVGAPTEPGRYTLGYTNTYVINGAVTGCKIYLMRGYEDRVIHEIGHVVSHYNGVPFYWAKTPEFMQIWAEERYNSTMHDQGYDDPVEYFACAYYTYFTCRKYLKSSCPKTYTYIQNVIANTI
ncbi:hypothetical protein IKE07_01550 [Candidatus Saccharibacteria bacterium]|nr:hypothetical protein [Candidatus Saccharibacteria bacterium]